MDVIRIERLTKYYGQRVGIDGLTLSVPEGGLFGFLGPNGSGKTTTIRVLMGFLKPSAGSAQLFGGDCWRDSARLKAEVGYLPGDPRLYSWLTPDTALVIWGRVRRRDILAHGREIAEDFGLPLDTPVGKMSRGMKQKLALILALAHRPRLLILDEPTSGLDPLVQDRLFRRLRASSATGVTVVFSSHTLSEVEELCDRVAILREGRLVEHATVTELAQRARRRFTIQWLDGAGAQLIPPPFVIELERTATEWRGTLSSSSVDFLAWCTGKPIADFTLGAPDLAQVFRGYYGVTEVGR